MNMNTTPPSPPRLALGTHLTPDQGACLMEWVSTLAGEPWSDAPATTHPLLAHLARLVNDAMTQSGRQRLVPLGPRLANLTSTDPAVTERLVVLVSGYALKVRPSPVLLWWERTARRHLRRAVTEPPAGGTRRALLKLSQRAFRHGPAYRAIEAAVAALRGTASGDDHLLTVLEHAITLVESQRSAPGPVPSHARRSGRPAPLTASTHAKA
jgi:hypothetical protein